MHHTAESYLGRRAKELGDQRSLSLSPSSTSFKLPTPSRVLVDESENSINESLKDLPRPIQYEETDDLKSSEATMEYDMTSNSNTFSPMRPPSSAQSSSSTTALSPTTKHMLSDHSDSDENIDDIPKQQIYFKTPRRASIFSKATEEGNSSPESSPVENQHALALSPDLNTTKNNAAEENKHGVKDSQVDVFKQEKEQLKNLCKKDDETKKILRAFIQALSPLPDGNKANSTPIRLRSLKDLSPYFVANNEEELESENEDEDVEEWKSSLQFLKEPNTKIRDEDEIQADELGALISVITQLQSSSDVKNLLREVLANPNFPQQPLSTPELKSSLSRSILTPSSATSATQTPPPIPPPPQSIVPSPTSQVKADKTDNAFNGLLEKFDRLTPGFSYELLTSADIPPGMFHIITETVTQAVKKRDIIYKELTRESLTELQNKLDAAYKKSLMAARDNEIALRDRFEEAKHQWSQQVKVMQKERKAAELKTLKLKDELEALYSKGKNDREIANKALTASQQQTRAFAQALHEAENQIKLLKLSGIDIAYDPNHELSLSDIERLEFVDDDYYDHYPASNVAGVENEEIHEEPHSERTHGTVKQHTMHQLNRTKSPRGYTDFGKMNFNTSRDNVFSNTKFGRRHETFVPSVKKFDFNHDNEGTVRCQQRERSRFDRVLSHKLREEEASLDEFFELRANHFNERQKQDELVHVSKLNKIKHRNKNPQTNSMTSFHRESMISSKKNDDEYYDEEWGGFKLAIPLKSKKDKNQLNVLNKIQAWRASQLAKKMMRDISPFEFFMFVVIPLSFLCLCVFVLVFATARSHKVVMH